MAKEELHMGQRRRFSEKERIEQRYSKSRIADEIDKILQTYDLKMWISVLFLSGIKGRFQWRAAI